MLALLATASHGFAGVTPKSSREPDRGFRSGVLTQLGLIPSGKKPAAQLQWLTDNLKLRTAAPYSQRREAVLRYRVAQQRSEVEKLANEINALEARNENLRARPETSARRCRTEEEANDERISTLRRDAGVAEGKILRLKLKLGEKKGASRPGLLGAAARAAETLTAAEERSAAVLFSQLRRESDPWALLREDIGSIARLGSNLTLTTGYLQLMSRGGGSRLPAHAAAIIARSAKLERYAPGILLAVDGYLDLIEPHLDNILERFDEIEPHLPWVLDNLDSLAPYCGTLLDHFDALMLYADEGGKYLPILLPYLPLYARKLDKLGPHLPLLRPHLPLLMPHLKFVAPYSERFAPYLSVSANCDILLWYFGWVFKLGALSRWIMRIPFLPRISAFLSKKLPRRPVRGSSAYFECVYDDCDVVVYEANLAARRAKLAADAAKAAAEAEAAASGGAANNGRRSAFALPRSLPAPPVAKLAQELRTLRSKW